MVTWWKFTSGETVETAALSADPERAVLIGIKRGDDVTGETVGGGEVGEVIAVKAGETLECGDPQISGGVASYTADQVIPQTIGMCEGLKVIGAKASQSAASSNPDGAIGVRCGWSV